MEDFKAVSGVLATIVTAQASLLVGSHNVGKMLILVTSSGPTLTQLSTSLPHPELDAVPALGELDDCNCRSLMQRLSIHF